MTENDDAVQITADAVNRYTHRPGKAADDVVAALARAGLLARPGELAALREVAERAESLRAMGIGDEQLDAALDALPASPPLPAEMADRARRHPNGEGLPGAGVADDPGELAARTAAPAVETASYDQECPWNSASGVHERGTGRDHGECMHCDEPMHAAETTSGEA